MVKVFVVEDNVDMIFLLDLMLKNNKIEVMATAQDGDEAIEKYREFSIKPDIILLDHRMPNKDGLEAMNEFVKINPSVKVIFLSADYSIESEALSNGAKFFLKKPINEELLIECIKKILKVA